MLEEGISYPFKGDSALGRIVVGSLLVLGSVLVVPAILFFGYTVRVLGEAARGNEEPPEFDEWGEMLVTGVKGIAVTLVYGIVPFAAMSVFLSTIAAGVASGPEGGAGGGILAGVGLLGILVSTVGLLVVYYLVPAALTNMAVEGNFGAAFDVGRLKSVLLSLDYLIAWLLPVVIAVVANFVVTILAFTIVGLVLVPTVQFLTQVMIFYMFGKAFGSVVDLDTGSRGSSVEATI